MSTYLWSARYNAFFPVVLKHLYLNAGWDLSDTIPIDDDVAEEFMGNPPEGKIRGVGEDELPCWLDVNPPGQEEQVN